MVSAVVVPSRGRRQVHAVVVAQRQPVPLANQDRDHLQAKTAKTVSEARARQAHLAMTQAMVHGRRHEKALLQLVQDDQVPTVQVTNVPHNQPPGEQQPMCPMIKGDQA